MLETLLAIARVHGHACHCHALQVPSLALRLGLVLGPSDATTKVKVGVEAKVKHVYVSASVNWTVSMSHQKIESHDGLSCMTIKLDGDGRNFNHRETFPDVL